MGSKKTNKGYFVSILLEILKSTTFCIQLCLGELRTSASNVSSIELRHHGVELGAPLSCFEAGLARKVKLNALLSKVE